VIGIEAMPDLDEIGRFGSLLLGNAIQMDDPVQQQPLDAIFRAQDDALQYQLAILGIGIGLQALQIAGCIF